ncbi:class I SAM-dependent methyltransferase [Massilia sp. TWR1-2-2]|uniref:class I SAM-dependent methyltransferase n=1 Tax=Massilia sp. TWR1-2-2 TaxID=2804584 RepID=UPI003CEB29B7
MSLALRRIWRAPAVQALLLQLAAAPLTVAALLLLLRAGTPVSLAGAGLLQGVCAAALSGWRRLAPWWLAIQLLFPLALLAGVSLQLPPTLFLGGFLILLLIYWSTFRTQVPYYPSGRRAWDAVAAVLPPDRPLFVIDIGSGLGGLVLDLARRRPDSTFVGIELAPLPWLASALRARLAGSGARFVRGDYEQLDLGDYDAVFAYLSPAAMDGLWRKASAEMRPGSLLLSYEFKIGAKPPDINIMPTGAGPALYGWRF